MTAYSPPFTLTHAMLSRVADITELVSGGLLRALMFLC